MADSNDGWVEVPLAAKTDDGWEDVSHELNAPPAKGPSQWERYKGLVGEEWDRSSINPKNVYNALTHVQIPIASNAVKAVGREMIPDAYANQQKADDAKFAEENPGANFAGSVIGGGVLPALPTMFGVGGKIAGPASSAIGKGAQYLGNAISRVGYGSALSAGDAELTGKDPLQAAIDTAKVGGAIEGGGALIKGAANYIPRFVFGVKPETEAYYRARQGQGAGLDENP